MTFTIVARLRDGRYDAAGIRPSQPEWPPHPARVFCALVASADDEADWTALKWLEGQNPPEVWANPPSATAAAQSHGYVVENSVTAKGGNLSWPGRTNGYKQRVSVHPADDTFALVWHGAEPDDALLGRLMRLARRVPYLGRTTSSVELTVVPETVELRESWRIYRPVSLGAHVQAELRVPYPGYTDALRSGYTTGQQAWELSRAVAYAHTTEPPSPEPQALTGPYADLVIWVIERPSIAIAGDRVLAVTDALRKAVISCVPDPVPPLVSGHGADGQPHVAYLGLPNVGHEHADGHLLALALAVPEQMEAQDRRRLLTAVLVEPELTTLRLPWGAHLHLRSDQDRPIPWGAMPVRWTAGAAGARTWVTANPVMLDRYPHRRDDPADLVAQTLALAGYPRPASVDVLPSPPLTGGLHRLRRGTVPAGRPHRPLVHCRVTFAQPLIGPIIAGSLRYLGLGLFVPDRAEEES